eukprot:CAMPEP_0185694932 /NCGR_PEP_ID=MMETSP1164-20130828/4216_1 /TAXON_ID=1104430 /ORGANISM="Chrysoreinhardia sp, Strain CCMP2950" /LENGTH=105 /DNA_ID=CAMNT_0028361789 /DNA_START=106 /DNA_END=420 /DNA_ORIENTATION=-
MRRARASRLSARLFSVGVDALPRARRAHQRPVALSLRATSSAARAQQEADDDGALVVLDDRVDDARKCLDVLDDAVARRRHLPVARRERALSLARRARPEPPSPA